MLKNRFNRSFQGIKDKNDFKNKGVEHEKFVLNKSSKKQLSYEEPNGIKDILLQFVKRMDNNFDDQQYDNYSIKRFGESITLEPGGQIELSGAQLSNIHQTCTRANRHLNELKELMTIALYY